MGRNAYTDFLQQHGGQGYSRAELNAMYHQQKASGETSDPRPTYKASSSATSARRTAPAAPVDGGLTWNEFRAAHKGMGYTLQEISAMYWEAKERQAAPRNYRPPIPESPAFQAAANTKKATQRRAPVSEDDEGDSGHGSNSEAEGGLTWNEFRAAHKGMGYTLQEISTMYWEAKERQAALHNHRPPSSSRPAPQAAANKKKPAQRRALASEDDDDHSGHGSNSEGDYDREDESSDSYHCPYAQSRKQAGRRSSYASDSCDCDSDECTTDEESDGRSKGGRNQGKQGRQQLRRQGSSNSLVSDDTHADSQGNERELATNLPAGEISKYWKKPILLWSKGDLVEDAWDLAAKLPTEQGIYMFQARAPDAKGWINLYLGKAEGADGLRQRVRTYFKGNKGIIALDADDGQKHQAMLNLQHRGFDLRLLYKIPKRSTAADSEARKLDEFKFPFNKQQNGNRRFVNPHINETGKRVNDYRVIHGMVLTNAGAPLDMTVMCQDNQNCKGRHL